MTSFLKRYVFNRTVGTGLGVERTCTTSASNIKSASVLKYLQHTGKQTHKIQYVKTKHLTKHYSLGKTVTGVRHIFNHHTMLIHNFALQFSYMVSHCCRGPAAF